MGPLAGLKIVEFAAVGPAPMCAMLLADLGATVLRIDRVTPVELGKKRPLQFDLLLRNREGMALDLKSPEGRAMAMDVVANADAVIEGMRPGVMERLGLGPDDCFKRQPKLVYGRMTGWGQTGPLADAAAHDLNYIAVTGALDAIGRAGQPPSIPINLLGDYAGGSLYLALGILAALRESERSGRGQVVDAAITDGVTSLMTSMFGLMAAGMWKLERGTNIADSGTPFYDVYACADGKFVTVAPIETRFFEDLLQRLDIAPADFPDRWDRTQWPRMRETLAARFRTRTRDDWCALLEGSDACFAPVLTMAEAPHHAHAAAREAFVEVGGVQQPRPAPRFSRTSPALPRAPRASTRDEALASLRDWFGEARYSQLEAAGKLAAVQGSEA
ncbi:CaiB/BaiF CoA transferase family protein [Variovorax sp. PBL-E5]|uniref:CaiB/BaiF CoA transferase family protein n=1 Tax=Variovorax sp. PBL-E5 TaxID=434014 RepID=UPI001317BB3D|nr:CaiB/BaiF CoA-transferase family protein [Variovorax sp. PBL-E5]VTU37551.1 Formyl-coenzyme A transferase [Variovorax sp. PBL-E5]